MSDIRPSTVLDYRDQKGILHCGICGKPLEKVFTLFGEERRVQCRCDCDYTNIEDALQNPFKEEQ